MALLVKYKKMEPKKLKRNRETSPDSPRVDSTDPSSDASPTQLTPNEKLEKLIQVMSKDEKNKQEGIQSSFSSSKLLLNSVSPEDR